MSSRMIGMREDGVIEGREGMASSRMMYMYTNVKVMGSAHFCILYFYGLDISN